MITTITKTMGMSLVCPWSAALSTHWCNGLWEDLPIVNHQLDARTATHLLGFPHSVLLTVTYWLYHPIVTIYPPRTTQYYWLTNRQFTSHQLFPSVTQPLPLFILYDESTSSTQTTSAGNWERDLTLENKPSSCLPGLSDILVDTLIWVISSGVWQT